MEASHIIQLHLRSTKGLYELEGFGPFGCKNGYLCGLSWSSIGHIGNKCSDREVNEPKHWTVEIDP